MRNMIFAGLSLVVMVAASPASAQDYPYCLQGRWYGYPGKCDFTSYAQCQATASGNDAFCGPNPRFAYGEQYRPRPERRYYREQW